ncbi:hypothetical protein [Streptomyces sp. NPDC102360]|uniref:hypothetical protein n=1 Tax=Streptomyces sp. NPDC102360 TaxID=3366160 RepID=UPI0037FE700D
MAPSARGHWLGAALLDRAARRARRRRHRLRRDGVARNGSSGGSSRWANRRAGWASW